MTSFKVHFLQIKPLGGIMGFKEMKTNFTFTDIALFASMEKNRAIIGILAHAKEWNILTILSTGPKWKA
jgi:hypothetical protein